MDNYVKIFGTQELVDTFKGLEIELQNKILKTSFKKAAAVIVSQAKSNLRGSYTGIRGSFSEKYNFNTQTLKVGSFNRLGGQLSNIVEGGTKERSYITKQGTVHKTGYIKAQHFWSNALTQTSGEVEETIFKDIRERFNNIINKNKTK